MGQDFKNIDFQWNHKASTIIENLGFGKELNKKAAEIFYEHAYKYVPYREGDLSINVRISATEDHGTITHLVKYASKQYYGEGIVNRTLKFHPLATSFWDKACWEAEKREITSEVDEARKKYSRNRRSQYE